MRMAHRDNTSEMERSQTMTQTLPVPTVTESQAEGPPPPIAVLDGVRAVACLGVLSFHVNLWAYLDHLWSAGPGDLGAVLSSLPFVGETGFLLFFVLSGFLLFLPYARSIIVEAPWPSARRYYFRRLFRILPGYYVALVFMLLYLSPEFLQPDHREQLWLFLTFRMDLPLTYQQINPPFWTLAIEFQFYLLLPLLAAIMGSIVRKGSLKRRVLLLSFCILSLLLWGVLTRYWGFLPAQAKIMDRLWSHRIWEAILPFIFGTSGKYIEVFALGMLLATIYIYLHHAPSLERLNRNVRRLSPLLFGSGLLVFLAIHLWHHHVVWVRMQFLNPYNDFLLPYKDIFTPLGYALGLTLCLFALLQGPNLLKRPLESRVLRWIGTRSYSLYLWHFPLVLYFSQAIVPKFQALGWKPVVQYVLFGFWALLVTVPLASLLFRWVEVPGMLLGEFCYKRLETARTGLRFLKRKSVS
jgi:peptidoglycan/LPS O-acetylase OafA/YrhL